MRFTSLILATMILLGFSLSNAGTQVSDEVLQIQKQIELNGLHWTAGQTSMMDLPLADRHARLGLIIPDDVKQRFAELNRQPPPALANTESYFDWRLLGGVTPVKDQGNCGSCWDFAAVGATEAAYLIAAGDTIDLSEQQVLSCNTGGSSCAGGWMQDAYDLFETYGAIYEWCMPYGANDQIPCVQENYEPAMHIIGYEDIPDDVNAIKNALILGPLSTTFTVFDDFFGYSGGCYEHPGNGEINHAVVIVGWDDNMCDGQGAWIVKNSWGRGFGMNGFFYIKYGSSDFGNYTQRPIYQEQGYPSLVFNPSLFSASLTPARDTTEILNLSNQGDGDLFYDINLTLPGHWDQYGYSWLDSSDPHGPNFNWVDISQIGQQEPFPDSDNGNSASKLLGFTFNYYGRTYNYIRFSINGFAYFMNAYFNNYINVGMPDRTLPNSLMAVFWDDLTLQYGGSIYFYTNHADSAVISWQNVHDTRQEGNFTFQIVLVAPDTIVYQYANMGPGRLNECTVGIENRTGTIGLQVAYNQDFIRDSLATAFHLGAPPTLNWVQLSADHGVIPAGGNNSISVSFSSQLLLPGTYDAILKLYANDQQNLLNDIPIRLTVESGCHYIAGDANADQVFNALDALYLVNYFRGVGDNPIPNCDCASHGMMDASADVNGDCVINGIDVLYMARSLRYGVPLLYCVDCPPDSR